MIVLCSFADSSLEKSLLRLKRQAKDMNVFDEVFLYNETFLEKSFRKKFKKQLKITVRGFGYWCWKPQIILQTLELVNDGDIVLYMDAGSYLNLNGKKRLYEYFDIINQDSLGILAFRSKNFREKELTKADVFNYFNVIDDIEYTESTQIEAGHIILKKNEQTVQFIKEWLEVISKKFSLIDDTPSISRNFKEFISHRHDQSIFSILAKKYNVKTVPISETYSDNWDMMDNFPLWAKRDKEYSRTFFQKVRLKIFNKFHI